MARRDRRSKRSRLWRDLVTAGLIAGGCLLAILLEGFLKLARSGLMDSTGRRIELSAQTWLMDRLLGMRASPADRRPSSTFAAMREFGAVREFFTASTIGSLADLPFILIFLALVASIAGKLAGLHMAGRVLRWGRGEAGIIGWLLQTKALIMIIFANVLLDKHIITSETFTALLLMAVMSTMLTVPMVKPRLARLGIGEDR